MNEFIAKLANILRRIGYDFHEAADPRVIAMQETIRRLGSIQFKIDVFPDGGWSAESTNIDGIASGGSNIQSFNELLKDAIFTYFEIPPHLCNDALMKAQDEPLQLEQRVYA